MVIFMEKMRCANDFELGTKVQADNYITDIRFVDFREIYMFSKDKSDDFDSYV
jgi:hypothetical protein